MTNKGSGVVVNVTTNAMPVSPLYGTEDPERARHDFDVNINGKGQVYLTDLGWV